MIARNGYPITLFAHLNYFDPEIGICRFIFNPKLIHYPSRSPDYGSPRRSKLAIDQNSTK